MRFGCQAVVNFGKRFQHIGLSLWLPAGFKPFISFNK